MRVGFDLTVGLDWIVNFNLRIEVDLLVDLDFILGFILNVKTKLDLFDV